MPELIDWRRCEDLHGAIARVVRALDGGQLVALPTETEYVAAASAVQMDAVASLAQLPTPPTGEKLLLVLRDAIELDEWLPRVGTVGGRLARRCWPGPVELLCNAGSDSGLVNRLPDPVRRQLIIEGKVAVCSPCHEALLEVLALVPMPLVVAKLAGTNESEPGRHIVQQSGGQIAVVLDSGATRCGGCATQVRVDGNRWDILREGVVPREHIAVLTGCFILFVCTGNTCRSPLAEALCKQILSERLGCPADELPRRGYIVQSAGLAAMRGGHAADAAVAIARELGADLSLHASQPVTPDLLAHVDHIVTMTRGQLHTLCEYYPMLAPRARLLCPEGEDIPDPIGSNLDVYRECAAQIRRHLERLVPEVHA